MKTIGWETWEYVTYALVNVLKCKSCEQLVNYNGLSPEICPKCLGKTGEIGTKSLRWCK